MNTKILDFGLVVTTFFCTAPASSLSPGNKVVMAQMSNKSCTNVSCRFSDKEKQHYCKIAQLPITGELTMICHNKGQVALEQIQIVLSF